MGGGQLKIGPATTGTRRVMASIDPGLREMGVALWDLELEKLIRADRVQSLESEARGPEAWHSIGRQFNKFLRTNMTGLSGIQEVVSEYFRVYDHKVGRQKEVLQLAGALGAIAGAISFEPEWRIIEPRTWTRGRSKIPNQLRIWNRLESGEKRRFVGSDAESIDTILEKATNPDSDRKTTGKWSEPLDAVGVGLYHLRRL